MKKCKNLIHIDHSIECLDHQYNSKNIKLTTCICGRCPGCGIDTTCKLGWDINGRYIEED